MALILFIAGGLVTALTGFTAEAFAGEGTTVPVFAVKDPNQLQVRVDDAVGVYGEEGNPLDFRTHLTIFRNGEEVKSGYTTVNDPLKYDGYRFHQVAFFGDGAALRIRDAATGNTVFARDVPARRDRRGAADHDPRRRRQRTAARCHRTDARRSSAGAARSSRCRGLTERLWIGIVARDEESWQLVAFDPQAGEAGKELRIDEGTSGAIDGLSVTFDDVAALPAAVGVDVPGGSGDTLAQLVEGLDGGVTLLLTGEGPSGDLAHRGRGGDGERIDVHLRGAARVRGHFGEARQRRVVHLDRNGVARRRPCVNLLCAAT